MGSGPRCFCRPDPDHFVASLDEFRIPLNEVAVGKFRWKFIFGLLSNPFLQTVVFATAEKQTPLVAKAPETLDLAQIQSWMNASVWALLSLNLVALVIFLLNILYPQISRAMNTSKSFAIWIRGSKGEKRKAVSEAIKEVLAEPPLADVSAPEVSVAPAKENISQTPKMETKLAASEPASVPASAPPQPEVDTNAINVAEEIDLPKIVEEIDLPKIPDDVVPPAAEVFTPPPVTTEIIPDPVSAAPATKNEITEVLSKAEEPVPTPTPAPVKSSSLPEPAVSGQTEPLPMMSSSDHLKSDNLKSIEETLNEALAGTTDATEEISIFDPAMIDNVLKDSAQKLEDQKK